MENKIYLGKCIKPTGRLIENYNYILTNHQYLPNMYTRLKEYHNKDKGYFDWRFKLI